MHVELSSWARPSPFHGGWIDSASASTGDCRGSSADPGGKDVIFDHIEKPTTNNIKLLQTEGHKETM